MSSRKREMLAIIAQIATIAAASFTLYTVIQIQGEIDTSKHLVNKTNQTVDALNILVDKTNQLLQTLNSTVTMISYQTALATYDQGAPFKVNIERCTYDEENNKINYSPVIKNKNDIPTPLKFMLEIQFDYESKPSNDGFSEPLKVGLFPMQTSLIEPAKQPQFELSFSEMFNETNELHNSKLFVYSSYKTAPYSDGNGIITGYTPDTTRHLIIVFEKKLNGWEITNHKNSVCS